MIKKLLVFASVIAVLLHIGYAIYFYAGHEANSAYQPALPENSTVLSQETSFTGTVGSQTAHDPLAFLQNLFLWSIPLTFISLMVLLFFIQNIQRRTS